MRVFFILMATMLLCQCSSAVKPEEIAEVAKPISPKKVKIVSPYSKPTVNYLAEAKAQEGLAKQQSLISAAGRLISDGQWQQGAAILAQTANLSPLLQQEKNLLNAQIDLIRNRPSQALVKLSSITAAEELSTYQKIQWHELLAQAFQGTNKTLESIDERIKLDNLLMDKESQTNNRRNLWLILTHIPQNELNAMAVDASNQSILQGWLQLAQIARTYRENSQSLLQALNEWNLRFQDHPAQHILPNPLDSLVNKVHAPPKQVALLLPLSGGLQGPGMAIRDGFMGEHKKSKDALMQVKTYDTNTKDVVSLYQQAIAEGADYVVGPLIKSQVAQIAAIPHPVSTLLLNDAVANVQENSYLFGLSPVFEATQVAIRAKSKGYNRALVIAPANEWGKEVSQAFTQQWQKSGGRLIDTFLYGSNDDLNNKMKNFLQISNSQQREKKIKELLGQKIQALSTRRQDFDMIFLLAYPSKARQIMPLLNYYYAGDIPVYATANVYGGSANPLKDKDLDGIIFCDIPWVFSHQAGTRNWPEQFNSYNRLYALGVDSYTLATQLNQLVVFPADQSEKGEGILYLKPSQQVARVLEWGQFKQGLVHSLGAAT